MTCNATCLVFPQNLMRLDPWIISNCSSWAQSFLQVPNSKASKSARRKRREWKACPWAPPGSRWRCLTKSSVTSIGITRSQSISVLEMGGGDHLFWVFFMSSLHPAPLFFLICRTCVVHYTGLLLWATVEARKGKNLICFCWDIYFPSPDGLMVGCKILLSKILLLLISCCWDD